MEPIEIRLGERQATLSGITRALDRQLDRVRVARVELRYSTQARQRMDPQAAKLAIMTLLREHGLGAAEYSVRSHESPIDDVIGEHVLRLFPVAAPPAVDPPPVAPVKASWLATLIPAWFGTPPSPTRQEPGLVAQPAPVSSAEAVRKLREAVRQGAALLETDTGTAVADAARLGAAVTLAKVVVRLASLNLVLEPLVRNDASAIARMLKAEGLKISDDFKLHYRFVAAQPGDGTGFAHESDIEVHVIAGRATPRPDLQPQDHHRAGQDLRPATPGLVDLDGTALPPDEAQAEPVVTVRVLGTMDAPFAQPFEMPFDRLPAQFDRAALERAGFELRHPGLLAVASNSCPLRIRQAQGGEVMLEATCRTGDKGTPLPMYYRPDTLQGLRGELALTHGPMQMVVNAPRGVIQPGTGRLLPALVIEVVPATPFAASSAAADWA